MAYGKIKADAIIWDNSGSDVEESMSNMAGKLNASGGAMTGNLTLNAQNELRRADSDSSNYCAIKAPATVGTNRTWTLPSAAPAANQTLSFATDGTISYVDPGSGYYEATAFYSDRHAMNASSLAISANTWTRTPIDQEEWDPSSLASVSSNIVTIAQAGTYEIEFGTNATYVSGFIGRLVSSGGTVYSYTQTCYSTQYQTHQIHVDGYWRGTVSAGDTFCVDLIVQSAYTSGLRYSHWANQGDGFDHYIFLKKLSS